MNDRSIVTTVRDGRSTGYGLAVLAIGFCANFFSGLVATLMAVYLPDSVRDLQGTLAESEVSRIGSYVGALFLAGWAFGGMSFGWAGDRIGRAKSLTIALFLIGVTTLLASWSPNWPALVALRLLSGIGVGASMVLSAVIVAETWGRRPKHRAVVVSILAVGFPIGIMASGAVTYLIPEWRTAFLIGLLPIVLAGLSLLFLKEPEQWSNLQSRSPDDKEQDTAGSLRALLQPENRTNFIVGGTIFGSMSIGIWSVFSWLPTWAQSLIPPETGGLQEGGTLIMLLGLGGIVGCLFAGFLANSFGRRTTLLFAISGAAFASILLLFGTVRFSPVIYLQTSFLSLFFGISQGILMTYIPELFPSEVRSTATGICFNAGRMVTATAVYFVGVLVPILGGYGNSLLIFSATYIIGFLACWFGEETRDITL